MTLPLRIVLSAGLAGIFLFCAFGFRATYEPGEASVLMTFRVIYGVAGLASLAGLAAAWRRKSRNHD